MHGLEIPNDAFCSISVQELVTTHSSPAPSPVHPALILQKRSVPPDLVAPVLYSGTNSAPWTRELPQPPPPPPPSDNPIHLSLSLGAKLGSGPYGVVYEVTPLQRDEGTHKMPKLVVKIARWSCAALLAREAWFYNELHSLQGSVVPKCYGLYDCVLQPGFEVSVLGDRQDVSPDWWRYDIHARRSIGDRVMGSLPLHDELRRLRDSTDCLSILLLERVGCPINIGLDGITAEAVCDDLARLFEDVTNLGVNLLPLESENIAHKHDDTPVRISPYREHEHRFRIFDLGCAVKTNMAQRWLHGAYLCNVRAISRDLSYGNDDEEDEDSNELIEDDGASDSESQPPWQARPCSRREQ
ncbi:unnamed protein product [Peniophora sp. CBMAI 1063]|nr:unnamed protein product [Peniophora sp. CBMAI 1063]